MKALSLREPYASLIMAGLKTIETRTWKTNYRGDILIHVSKSRDTNFLARFPLITFKDKFNAVDQINERIKENNFFAGQVIGVMELYDVQPMRRRDRVEACIDYSPNLFSWFIRDIRPVEPPFHVKGELRLFEVGYNHELGY
jgi:activating signal cointegrator 1